MSEAFMEVNVTTDGGDNAIHYVDAARVQGELRTVCGASTCDVQWTTLRAAATCAECATRQEDQGRAEKPALS